MASRRSSRSREDYRHARDPLDSDCRPVLCIRDDDCKISLKSYGGSEGINLTEIQNCVSGGPLKQSCQVLVRQLGAFPGKALRPGFSLCLPLGGLGVVDIWRRAGWPAVLTLFPERPSGQGSLCVCPRGSGGSSVVATGGVAEGRKHF